MTRNTIFTSTLLIVLSLGASVFAQSPDDEFVNGQGRFAIRTDSRAQVGYGQIVEDAGDLSAFGDLYAWNDDKRYVSVAHMTFWQTNVRTWTPELPAAAKMRAINHYKKLYRDEFTKFSATVVESPFSRGDAKGIEFRVNGELRSVVRIFFHGNRFYILVVKQKTDGFTEQSKILDSFRMLNLDEYNTALIRDSEPAALEQNVPSGIRPTDAIEMGLKGSVKAIVEEIESGVAAKRKRHLHATENFSRLGHLTRRVTYFEGYVDSIGNFGWVDGIRAINLAPITHRGERTIMTRRAALVGFGAPEGHNKILRAPDGSYHDRRYTAMFETKYNDQWQPTERREVSNSGDVNHVEKITVTKTGRDIRTEDNSGGFLGRRFEVIGPEGNITELRTLDDRGGLQSSVKYKYEFDEKGNWIVRRSVKVERGRPVPSEVHYRKIEYYEKSDLDTRATDKDVTF